jgi:phosphohistidine phosphatase
MLLGIIRHGIAEDPTAWTGHEDAARRLTSDGEHKMTSAAAGIRRLEIRPDVVITSPLTRCAQTAAIVAQATGSSVRPHDALRPGATTDAILGVLSDHPDAACIVICGHQPDLSYLTEELTGGIVDYRRGMLGMIDLAALRPRGGRLVALYPPKSLRLIGGTIGRPD